MDSESCESDIIFANTVRRIIKYFSKSLIELLRHAESIQYKNNKIINYDVSSKLKIDDESGGELDIIEHNIKVEIEKRGPIFNKINKLKKYLVELLTLCSRQNIQIDYDTSRPNIAVYDAFDDPQRILIMNHLTLNTISLLQNIHSTIKFLKSSSYLENGEYIKKTFSKVYKEIRSLPMRPDIIENMDSSFKSLSNKSEYTDSYNYLVEQLTTLCKYFNKFNKTYNRHCGYNDILTSEDNTDDDTNLRKKKKNKLCEITYIKPENINVIEENNTVFKIPETIPIINPEKKTVNSDVTRKKKKGKINFDVVKTNANKSENIMQSEFQLNLCDDDISNSNNIRTINLANQDTESNKSGKSNMNTKIENKSKKKKEKGSTTFESIDYSCSEINKFVTDCTNKNKLENQKTEMFLNEPKEPINTNIKSNKTEKRTEKKKKRKLSADFLNEDNTLGRDIQLNETKKNISHNENNSEQKEIETESLINKLMNDTKKNLYGTKKSKKRKIDLDNKIDNEKQINMKRKLSNGLNSLDNISNSEEKKKLNLTNANQDEEEYNKIDNTFNDIDNELEIAAFTSELLTAFQNGTIEFASEGIEDLSKIISDNNLSENEKFLFIQDFAETARNKVSLSEETKEALRNLRILVNWEVPPAHEVCSGLSCPPTAEEKIKLAALGVTIKKPFTSKETKIIQRNWKLFCKTHDLEDDPTPFMLLKVDNEKLLPYEERKKFIQFLGRGLPNKALSSIFRRFKCIFRPKRKLGRFTAEEDELILMYLDKIRREENKNKFVNLAPLLNRDRAQIERRYKLLRSVSEKTTKRIHWDLNLESIFLKHLLEETHSTSIEELRDKKIELDVFVIIGELMNIAPLKLKMHWLSRLYTQLFAVEPINSEMIKMRLIIRFHELKCNDWKTINWDQITSQFDGVSKGYLWNIMKNLINFHTPTDIQSNLKASVDYLHSHYIPIAESKLNSKDTFIPRLQYEDGILSTYE